MAIDRVRVNEGSAKTVTFTLRDSAGVVVPLSAVDSAVLTRYDLDTFVLNQSPSVGIVNSRDAQDVKNANNVTIHATSGLVTYAMPAEDQAKPDGLSAAQDNYLERRQLWRHRCLFLFVVSSVHLTYELEVEVLNLRGQA